MYVCVHVCVCVCMRVCVYMYLCVCVCAYLTDLLYAPSSDRFLPCWKGVLAIATPRTPSHQQTLSSFRSVLKWMDEYARLKVSRVNLVKLWDNFARRFTSMVLEVREREEGGRGGGEGEERKEGEEGARIEGRREEEGGEGGRRRRADRSREGGRGRRADRRDRCSSEHCTSYSPSASDE